MSEFSDVTVVGAGPAGLAAAESAARAGASVLWIDESPHPGGQIWRKGVATQPVPELAAALARLEALGVEYLGGHAIVDAPARDRLVAVHAGRTRTLKTRRIILACGARELFLPFEGWTSPGVVGVGAMQAMLAAGLDVRALRVVVAGTGPLLAVVVRHLLAAGAEVLMWVEQGAISRILHLLPGMLEHPALARQACALAWATRAVSKSHGARVVSVTGQPSDGAETLSVTLASSNSARVLACDLLACSYGLVANTELAELLGCALTKDRFVAVDERGATNVPGVYAVGEMTGVRGKSSALLDGRVAGCAAAADRSPSLWHRWRRGSWRRWQRALHRCFELSPQLQTLPQSTTIVCRCEDVPWAALSECPDSRSARLYTRCGMGACQGRICGPALAHLRGFESAPARAPIRAVSCAAWPPAPELESTSP